jgi:hypothetical protein
MRAEYSRALNCILVARKAAAGYLKNDSPDPPRDKKHNALTVKSFVMLTLHVVLFRHSRAANAASVSPSALTTVLPFC